MRKRLIRLARKLQDRPWNQSGAEKTWVLQMMWQQRLFVGEVQQAKRVDDA